MNTADVPVFILAGGLGTRFSEETHLKPKPMIEIGDLPILLHIMRYYHAYGFNDFVICAGYKSWEIKEYFLNYRYRQNNFYIDHRTNVQEKPSYEAERYGHEKWRVRVIDTGLNSLTGSRLAIAHDYVSTKQKIDTFAVTYGDGLCDANLSDELAFHTKHKKIGTVLGVPPMARFGILETQTDGLVTQFLEKPESSSGLINGGFFFFNSHIRKYLDNSGACILERDPLEKLVKDKELAVFEHRGFWQCMDTLRDKNYLQSLWDKNEAPWKR